MELNEYSEPEGDFIPGIFNYCDAWCERCIYTDKCRVFASSAIMKREIEAEKKREKSIAENKEFWNQINDLVAEVAELIDEELPLTKDIRFPLFDQLDDDDDDEDAEEAMKDYEKKRNRAKAHNLAKVSSKYEKAVYNWFEERKDTKIVFDADTYLLNFHYSEVSDSGELEKLSNSADIINWYHIQIWVKINRALTSYYDEQEDAEFYSDFPKDSDGSAMVVINGIDRSIAAWNYLRNTLTSEKKIIRQMIQMLVWLRMEMEKLFPNAKNFIWPPKIED